MWRAVLRRLGSGAVVLWAAATAAYLALHLAPGDTVDTLVGDGPDTPQIRAQIAADLGLDRPAVVQYVTYLWRLLHGDFGRSYVLQRPVTDIIASQVWPTVKLTLAASAFTVVLALGLALLSTGRTGRWRWVRGLASALELSAVSAPGFLIGILLLSVFSFRYGWFPVSGDRDLSALVLPALSLALPLGGLLSQVIREGLERALDEPFAVTARSRGLTRQALLWRHALRHALLPAVTLAGTLIGFLLSAAVVVERVFGRPGLGQVATDAVGTKDIPVVLAVVMLSAAIYVALSTVADLTYLIIDPRLRKG
ncbi:ABC transporter permease [Dactylosporangium matsuzakiense]|uniref:ABC transporter permease n=1 Tax=Dactylosporangium matsuzakiense TaxID=53360 RepID=A0A9W6KQX6_9ACTN|nr:ABC transporter permease [Dactylosporangium matsuzakiense]UWZ49122.1 ABC transporter permease [Dactylosporangium matsuzakiense]GLL06526.1 ABC transporter permease [Dactylosporangium matsuzakiense]